MRTYTARSTVISGSNGKPGVVAIVRTAKLGLPPGNSVASWVLYHPAAVVCWVNLVLYVSLTMF